MEAFASTNALYLCLISRRSSGVESLNSLPDDNGGGGIVVVEELEHALARGAHIYAEITGYGATSDGYDMVAPSGEGAARCMRQAMQDVESIDF